jgi:DNA-binding GntR family transcriptional regulator
MLKEPLTGIFLPPSRRLGHEIARYIRDGIISGTFPAGQRLAPLSLAADFGVSAMPVREALLTLASEGLVVVLPRRGFRVGTVRPRDIEDTFRVHAFVAGLLAAEAAPVIQEATLKRLEALQSDIEQINAERLSEERTLRIEKLNFDFHRTINTVSDADRLRWFLRTASRYVPRHFYEFIPGWVQATVADHPPIVDALRQRDSASARLLMERHVLKAGTLVVQNLWLRKEP